MKEKETSSFAIHAVEKKSAFVAKWVVAAVRKGRWKVGDRLPPERVIAEQLGVSRTAVREALSSLQMVDLIEPRVGDGNYVSGSIEAEIDIDEALQELKESESLVEVWEVRKQIEIILAKLAVEKASEDDLINIECCIGKIEEAVEVKKDADEYLIAHNDFHLAMAEAAKNTFLKRSLLPLLEITKEQLTQQIDKEYVLAHATSLVEKHRDILNALKRRDQAAVTATLIDHFTASEEFFLAGSK
ncbi:MAG: FCD domain-containing protein [Candidatus Bipolaricaulota bacterium]|nr:FCD domain-containing protein [Candidatus Bipolaricaulota bacterium]